MALKQRTGILVQQPSLGKSTRQGAERILGTVLGCGMGLACEVIIQKINNETLQGIFASVILGIAGYFIPVLGAYFKLECSIKLFGLTLVMVLANVITTGQTYIFVLFRVSGIIIGVLFSHFISLVIYPVAATDQMLESIVKAVNSMQKLNDLVWANIWQSKTNSDMDEKIDEFEEQLSNTIQALRKAEDAIGPAQNEFFVCRIGCRRFYLPGSFFTRYGCWKVPSAQIKKIVKDTRSLSRQMWTMYTMYQQGFGNVFQQFVNSAYPRQLIPLLQENSNQALKDIAFAFPNEDFVARGAIEMLKIVVEAILHVSEYMRRKLMNQLQHTGNLSPANSRELNYVQLPSNNRQLNPKEQKQKQEKQEQQTKQKYCKTQQQKFGQQEDVQIQIEQQERSGHMLLNIHELHEDQQPLPLAPHDTAFEEGSFHSAREAFENLPQKLKIRLGSQVSPRHNSPRFVNEEDGGVNFIIPVNLQNQIPVFPNNLEGFNAKIKWYSFQILVQQYVELLVELHDDISDVLPLLPKENKFFQRFKIMENTVLRT